MRTIIQNKTDLINRFQHCVNTLEGLTAILRDGFHGSFMLNMEDQHKFTQKTFPDSFHNIQDCLVAMDHLNNELPFLLSMDEDETLCESV